MRILAVVLSAVLAVSAAPTVTHAVRAAFAKPAAPSGSAFGVVDTSITAIQVDVSSPVAALSFPVNTTQYGTPPACATITNRMTINPTSTTGKAAMEAALAAYLSKVPVYVQGTGQCSDDPSIESALLLTLH
jgi:hypothetical protein